MKKRLFSILLTLCLLLSLVPMTASAHNEDCSEHDSHHSDCTETHSCGFCGSCNLGDADWCSTCGMCDDCAEKAGYHCAQCGTCHEADANLCSACGKCKNCCDIIDDSCTLWGEELCRACAGKSGKTACTETFCDVSSDMWFAPYVQSAVDCGFMSGTGDTCFDPYGSTSRAMFVQILYAMADKPSVAGMTCPFTDIPAGSWYHDAVFWAYNCHVTDGTSADTFSPDAPVTREQVAQLLYARCGKPHVSGNLRSFCDNADAHSWACDALIWASQNGIMSGSSDSGLLCLNPLKCADRAETATMMTGFYHFCED